MKHFIVAFLLAGAAAFAADLSTELQIRPRTTGGNDLNELVVVNGVLTQYTVNGAPAAATLRNLVQLIRRRYPDINLTAVGVDNVLIKDLTLEWGSENTGATHSASPPLDAVLAALSAAANREFDFKAYSPHDFLLTRQFYDAHEAPKRANAFDIAQYLGLPNTAFLDAQLTELRARRDVLRASASASVAMNELSDMERKIAVVEAQMKHRPSETVIAERLKELQTEANEAIAAADPEMPLPTYQFHPGTHLLVVVGTPGALAVANEVISAYRHDK